MATVGAEVVAFIFGTGGADFIVTVQVGAALGAAATEEFIGAGALFDGIVDMFLCKYKQK